mmetsp:Transcript_18175/g.25284  ORF Transcript_18175/g.25284 Transcript_18175/m.25284 type:complete len:205 (-) Transcript_18175:75-689(-)
MPRLLQSTTWGSSQRLPEPRRPTSPGPVYVPNLKFVRRNALSPEFQKMKRFQPTVTNSGRKIPFDYYLPGGKNLVPINHERVKLRMKRSLPTFRTDGKCDTRTNVAYRPESPDFVWQWNETGRADWCNSSSSQCMGKYGVYLKPNKRDRGTMDLAPYEPGVKTMPRGGKFSKSPRWDDRIERRMRLARRLARALEVEDKQRKRR